MGQVEGKVTASTGAAAASGLILWLLSAYVFRGGVPDVIVSWVYVLVPGALAFTAGYRARHTPRPVPAAVHGPPPPPTVIIPAPTGVVVAASSLQPPAAAE